MNEATPDDLDDWIRAFRGPLIGLVASFGLDWRAAEEVAQDVFAEAWIGRSRLQGNPRDLPTVGAWLRGIAFHLLRTEQRSNTRRRAQSIDGVTAAAIGAPITEPFGEQDERREQLVEAFAEMSDAFQTILRMHYLEESSAREVAALLGISQKAVESRLYQARRDLRQRIDRIAQRSVKGTRS